MISSGGKSSLVFMVEVLLRQIEERINECVDGFEGGTRLKHSLLGVPLQPHENFA